MKGNPNTDALLATARSGDSSAASELLERHRDRLRQMVRVRMDARLTPRVDASDVVQETLAKAAKRLPGYLAAPPLPFYPWLRQIAQDCLADLQRRHLRAKRTVVKEERFALSDASAVALTQRLFTQKDGPLSRMLRAELLQLMRRAMEQLAETDREVLTLRYLEELTTRDAAAVLHISESAAKLRLLRAVQRLRELLDLELTG